MQGVGNLFIWIICICVAILTFVLFEKTAKKVLWLLANSVIGVILLIILGKSPITLAVNLQSVTTAFVLGVPGVAALLIIKFVFQI